MIFRERRVFSFKSYFDFLNGKEEYALLIKHLDDLLIDVKIAKKVKDLEIKQGDDAKKLLKIGQYQEE